MKVLMLLCLAVRLLVSCSQENSSRPEITNGIVTTQFPAIVETVFMGRSICTGAFIRPDVLLTAAHCVAHKDGPLYITQLNTASTRIVSHPDYADHMDERPDLALIFFSRQVSNATLSIEYSQPAEHAPVAIVGYGGNQIDDGGKSVGYTGEKRIGRNVIQSINQNWIIVEGTTNVHPAGAVAATGELASPSNGDSGGPLLDKDDRIIGVASGGKLLGNGLVRNGYVPLSKYKSFIEGNLANKANFAEPPFMTLCLGGTNPSIKSVLLDSLITNKSCLGFYDAVARDGSIAMANTHSERQKFDLAILPATLPWTKSLYINGNNLEFGNVSALAELKQLTDLYLDHAAHIADLAVIGQMYSLETLWISPAGHLDLTPVLSLPHLKTLMIDGVSKAIVNPLKALLAGHWASPCVQTSENGGDRAVPYGRAAVQYDPAQGKFSEITKYYSDALCAGPVFFSQRTEATVEGIYPLPASKGVDALDLNNADNSWITVWDESKMMPAILTAFKTGCPYKIGEETRCPVTSVAAPFTIIKLDGDKLYFGADDESGNDGSSKTKRHAKVDTVPFIRQPAGSVIN